MSETDKAVQASWLGIAKLAHDELQLVLSLLGLDVPERMQVEGREIKRPANALQGFKPLNPRKQTQISLDR